MKLAVLVSLVVMALAVAQAAAAQNQHTSSLPAPCMVPGKVLCISKAERKLRFVQNGRVRLTLDARFGDARGPGYRTREGSFSIFRKVPLDRSLQYNGALMPYSMYFSGGQAVHYSYSFASEGYYGASHGCVNIRDMSRLKWLYYHVPLGTPVYIYSS